MEEKREEILRVLNYYKQLLEQKGYKVIYVALYGSQNYNVDDEKSDIDAKAIVLPTLSDIIHRKPVSAVLETEYGAIDYKDIITFNDVIKKGNFSYIEAIQSSYRIGDLENIDKLFGNIKVNLKSIIGGMKEKRKALTHEYPSKTEEFNFWNCDPKQFHHIWRLADVLNYNLQNNENRSYYKSLQVISEDGTILQTLEFPNKVYGGIVKLVIIGKSRYLAFGEYEGEDDFHCLNMYKINKSADPSKVSIATAPMRVSVSPRMASRNQDINVVAEGNGVREVIVTNAAGQVVYSTKVAAGENNVRISSRRLSSGLNVVSVKGADGKEENCTVIVKK